MLQEGQTNLRSLFEKYLHTQRIFKNKDVLRHSYTPRELPHRREQIETLVHILVPVLRGRHLQTSLCMGRPELEKRSPLGT